MKSDFVEPNPGRRGWRSRYNYASHGLRFDVRRATESTADFEKRINQTRLRDLKVTWNLAVGMIMSPR
jgi:hypothetical protein